MKRTLLEYHVKRIPNCTNYDEFVEWRKFASSYRPPHSIWFCTDCTPSFQLKMRKEGKCDHPYIKFRLAGDDIEGYVDANDEVIHNQTVEKLNGLTIK